MAENTQDQTATRIKRSTSRTDNNDIVELSFSVPPESWRFIAYLMFWLMCILAIILSKTLVEPYLAKGPEDGSVCGPFNRDDPDFGVSPGQGFDFSTQSHLKHLFGFSKFIQNGISNCSIHCFISILHSLVALSHALFLLTSAFFICKDNICAYWDYSPSRELTAMFYPLFEYSLLIYLCLDFLATAIANKRGQIKPWFWRFSQIVFPLCIFLCSQFRMIFVSIAYENVQGHTAGFLGLQVALILIAFHNAIFIWESNTAYKQLGGPQNGLRNTRIGIIVYLVGQVSIFIAKVYATIYVVSYGKGAPWTLRPLGSVVAGQVVDWIWMIFNAIIPLILAFFRCKNEAPLVITVSQITMHMQIVSNDETMHDETMQMQIASNDDIEEPNGDDLSYDDVKE